MAFPPTLASIRLGLLNVLKPVTELIGNIHMPFSVKLVTGEETLAAQEMMTPGMIFIVRTEGQMDNLAIPGFWTHAATVTDSEHIVEATGLGVHASNLYDFLLRKDYAALLKPKFATPDQMKTAAQYVVDQIGAKYDYDFLAVQDTEATIAAGAQASQRAFYCSKLPWAAYRHACGPDVPFTTRLTLGVQTVVPEDYARAVDKWEVVWKSSKAGEGLPSPKA